MLPQAEEMIAERASHYRTLNNARGWRRKTRLSRCSDLHVLTGGVEEIFDIANLADLEEGGYDIMDIPSTDDGF